MTVRHALGVHIGHDRGAAIVSGGELVAQIAEERLDRKKHSSSPELPLKSIRAVLDGGGVRAEDLNVVGISYTGKTGFKGMVMVYEPCWDVGLEAYGAHGVVRFKREFRVVTQAGVGHIVVNANSEMVLGLRFCQLIKNWLYFSKIFW